MIHINNTFGTLFALQGKLRKCYLFILCCISLNAHNSSEITRKWSDSGKVILLSRNGEEPALKSRLVLHNTASQCQNSDSQLVNHTEMLEITHTEKNTQKSKLVCKHLNKIKQKCSFYCFLAFWTVTQAVFFGVSWQMNLWGSKETDSGPGY